MKKKAFLTTVTLLLTLAFIGPAPALASDVSTQSTQSGETSILRADEYITYYRTYNGVCQYRVWNATDGVWVTPWINC